MSDTTTLIIALVCLISQIAVACFVVREHKKAGEVLVLARKKRKAAVTILKFAELWRRPMSDDQRVDLIIEWRARLREAEVVLDAKDEDENENQP